jgi:SAM-dependent methyltransferase
MISRFGLAHFGDTPTAFANLRHALRPGGRLAFAEWGPAADNVWMTVVGEVARRVLPAASMHRHTGTHGRVGDRLHGGVEDGVHDPATRGHAPEFNDAGAIHHALTQAGWAEVQVDLVADRAWLGSSAAEIVEWVFASELPSGFSLLDRVVLRRFRTALTRELARYTEADGIRLPAAAWLVSAVNPQPTAESNGHRS